MSSSPENRRVSAQPDSDPRLVSYLDKSKRFQTRSCSPGIDDTPGSVLGCGFKEEEPMPWMSSHSDTDFFRGNTYRYMTFPPKGPVDWNSFQKEKLRSVFIQHVTYLF